MVMVINIGPVMAIIGAFAALPVLGAVRLTILFGVHEDAEMAVVADGGRFGLVPAPFDTTATTRDPTPRAVATT